MAKKALSGDGMVGKECQLVKRKPARNIGMKFERRAAEVEQRSWTPAGAMDGSASM
jgi:hypothetical protein